MDIEIMATMAVKRRLALCDGLFSYIKERDVEPIWDGNIYVYSTDRNYRDGLIARVPVQIRGQKKTFIKKTRALSYQVKVSDLKHFFNDGGVIFFVVDIGDGENTTIFYQSLLPFDLNSLLMKAVKNKSMMISLRALPDDNDAIRQLFISFIEDKKRQAAKIIWTEEQAIEAFQRGDFVKFHIQTKGSPKNYADIMKEATAQSFYLYVEIKDGIELPFGKVEEGASVMTQQLADTPVVINGIKYYDHISRSYENGNAFLLIGHCIKLPIAEKNAMSQLQNIPCALTSTLSNRIADSDFLLALSESNNVIIASVCTLVLNIEKPEDVAKLRQVNMILKRIKAALRYFGVSADLDMSNLTKLDFKSINDLILASEGRKVLFVEKNLPSLFYYRKTIGNISIGFLAKKENDNDFYKLSNAFADNAHMELELTLNNGEIITANPWSFYLHMTAEDFLCSNADFNRILASIKAMKVCDRELTIRFSKTRNIGANNMLLEIIKAYDSQKIKNKHLLQFAEDMADIVMTTEPITIINKYQIIKRKRSFTNDEIANLVSLREAREEKVYKCAVSILLDELKEAKMLLEELSFDERKQITDYPIYILLTAQSVPLSRAR